MAVVLQTNAMIRPFQERFGNFWENTGIQTRLRAAALDIFPNVEPEEVVGAKLIDSERVEAALQVLEHSNAGRAAALDELCDVDPKLLAEHVNEVAQCLADEDDLVRAAAVSVLVRLEPAVIRQYGDMLQHWLGDSCPMVRVKAVETLSRLEPHTFAGLTETLVLLLKDCDFRVRAAAADALKLMDTCLLLPYESDIAERISEDDPYVRRAALSFLGKLELALLQKHSSIIVPLVSDMDALLRGDAVSMLSRLGPDVLQQANPSFTQLLGDDSAYVREKAAAVLGSVDSSLLLSHASELVQWVCSEDRIVRKALVAAIHRHPACLLHVKNENGDTALHVAAKAGHLDTCEALVRLGALIKARNRQGHIPETLAEHGQHGPVCRFFRRLENVTTVRGGMGDALEQALNDERPVTRVEWFTIPLPGVAGYVGGFHSLLAVTVGDNDGYGTYVIEKAALIRGSDEKVPEQYKNGVHVSHWVDVMPNVENDAPLYCLDRSEIENNTGSEAFCMRTLRQIAVDLGPYNVGEVNCHHAALEVYNACAKENAKVPSIPNHYLTSTAWFLSQVGVDVANSGSSSVSVGVQSNSVAASIGSGSASMQAASGSQSLQSKSRATCPPEMDDITRSALIA